MIWRTKKYGYTIGWSKFELWPQLYRCGDDFGDFSWLWWAFNWVSFQWLDDCTSKGAGVEQLIEHFFEHERQNHESDHTSMVSDQERRGDA